MIRLAVILILTMAFFATQTFIFTSRLQHERDFYLLASQQRLQFAIQGWQSEWQSHLTNLIRSAKTSLGYHLFFNLAKRESVDLFLNPKIGDWRAYQTAKKNNDTKKMQALLEEKLSHKNWDQILAAKEWKQQNFPLPLASTLTLSPMAKSQVSEEARRAYKLIMQIVFSEFFVPEEATVYKGVYIEKTQPHLVVFSIPSIEQVNNHFQSFLKLHDIQSGRLLDNPFSAEFKTQLTANPLPVEQEWPLHVLSLTFLTCGIGLIIQAWLQNAKRSRLRQSFWDQMLHELKTPLAGLKVYLHNSDTYGHSQKISTMMHKAVNRMDRLFEQILHISLSEGKPNLISLSGDDIVSMIHQLSLEFQHNISVSGDHDWLVMGESKRLTIILRNLIHNGIRYGNTVSIYLEAFEHHIQIIIQDQGPGIQRREAQAIWKRFYRSPEALQKSVQGLGLGLHIVQRLAIELDADVSLANPGEKGARFVISMQRTFQQPTLDRLSS